jgi:hypothetical protein
MTTRFHVKISSEKQISSWTREYHRHRSFLCGNSTRRTIGRWQRETLFRVIVVNHRKKTTISCLFGKNHAYKDIIWKTVMMVAVEVMMAMHHDDRSRLASTTAVDDDALPPRPPIGPMATPGVGPPPRHAHGRAR